MFLVNVIYVKIMEFVRFFKYTTKYNVNNEIICENKERFVVDEKVSPMKEGIKFLFKWLGVLKNVFLKSTLSPFLSICNFIIHDYLLITGVSVKNYFKKVVIKNLKAIFYLTDTPSFYFSKKNNLSSHNLLLFSGVSVKNYFLNFFRGNFINNLQTPPKFHLTGTPFYFSKRKNEFYIHSLLLSIGVSVKDYFLNFFKNFSINTPFLLVLNFIYT